MVRATDGDGDTVTYSIASGMQCPSLWANVVCVSYKITYLPDFISSVQEMIQLLTGNSPSTVGLDYWRRRETCSTEKVWQHETLATLCSLGGRTTLAAWVAQTDP